MSSQRSNRWACTHVTDGRPPVPTPEITPVCSLPTANSQHHHHHNLRGPLDSTLEPLHPTVFDSLPPALSKLPRITSTLSAHLTLGCFSLHSPATQFRPQPPESSLYSTFDFLHPTWSKPQQAPPAYQPACPLIVITPRFPRWDKPSSQHKDLRN